MSKLLDAARARPLLYDGSKGVMLQEAGLPPGEPAELWNLTHPEEVRDVHRQYVAAGSEVIQTNTFPGNRVTLERYGLGERFAEINSAGVRLAREAAADSCWVAASVGPTGMLLEPAGELTFAQAYDLYAQQVAVLAAAGADAIHFETFTDLGELRAAVLAAVETTTLPVIATATFEGGGRTLAGNSPEACAVVCEGLGVSFAGANCSTGPEDMVPVMQAMARVAAGPLVAKPNAGLPEIVEGRVVYREPPEHFADSTQAFVACGVRLVGGCCGTTPEFVRSVAGRLASVAVLPHRPVKDGPFLASAFHVARVGPDLLIGEIGPRVAAGGSEAILERAAELAAEGASCISIDFGDDADMAGAETLAAEMAFFVRQPLLLRAHAGFLQRFLRRYTGRPGVLGGTPSRYGAVVLYPEDVEACPRVGASR